MSINNPVQNRNDQGSINDVTPRKSWEILLGRIIMGVVILSVSGYIAYYWFTHKPRATRKPREKKAALVEVVSLKSADHDVTVDAMGTVIPARRLDIASRVSGDIVRVSEEFFPGGHLKKGDLVVEIDKSDYELLLEDSKLAFEKASLAITKSELNILQSELEIEKSEQLILEKKAEIIKAEKDLALEEGQQKIAKREYEVLGETISEKDKELVLRKPQLKAAKAAVAAAKARLEGAHAAKRSAEAAKRSAEAEKKSAQAEKSKAEVAIEKANLDLNRTNILAPFNAVIQEKKVETGAHVNVGEPIATIVGSNEYWIQVLIPVDRLKWIRIPESNGENSSRVMIFHEAAWGSGAYRTGYVKRLMTEVETEGRMARILVSVKDPLSLKETNPKLPKMILGSYVRLEIEGSRLSDVICIPRTALRDENHIWIMGPDSTLDIRKVDIIWGDDESVCISNGIDEGELLITSDLAAPVQSMALRRLEEESSDAADTGAEKKIVDMSGENSR